MYLLGCLLFQRHAIFNISILHTGGKSSLNAESSDFSKSKKECVAITFFQKNLGCEWQSKLNFLLKIPILVLVYTPDFYIHIRLIHNNPLLIFSCPGGLFTEGQNHKTYSLQLALPSLSIIKKEEKKISTLSSEHLIFEYPFPRESS